MGAVPQDCDSCGAAIPTVGELVQVKFPDTDGVMGAIIDLCLKCGAKVIEDPKAKKARDNWDSRQPSHAEKRAQREAKRQGVSPAVPATPMPLSTEPQPVPEAS